MSDKRIKKDYKYDYIIKDHTPATVVNSDIFNYNEENYKKGEEWFNSGLSLDEAPDNMKNDVHFIRGYERGKRLALIEEKQKAKKTR